MDEKKKVLAKHIITNANEIIISKLRANNNGAVLWEIFDNDSREYYYVIEGETGELLSPMDRIEDAIEAWDNS